MKLLSTRSSSIEDSDKSKSTITSKRVITTLSIIIALLGIYIYNGKSTKNNNEPIFPHNQSQFSHKALTLEDVTEYRTSLQKVIDEYFNNLENRVRIATLPPMKQIYDTDTIKCFSNVYQAYTVWENLKIAVGCMKRTIFEGSTKFDENQYVEEAFKRAFSETNWGYLVGRGQDFELWYSIQNAGVNKLNGLTAAFANGFEDIYYNRVENIDALKEKFKTAVGGIPNRNA